MRMTLGSVGKASYSEFAGKRKLLLVPYVMPRDDSAELAALINSYWQEAVAQVQKLQQSLGDLRHLFHEGSVGDGEEALAILEQGNPAGFPHLKSLIDAGAVLEPTEDVESLKETLDLHRCLSVVQASRTVLTSLVDWFEESRTRRYAAIAEQITSKMPPDAVGMLVISEEHRVQFPDDIEVVYVMPPALDRINRWLRDHPSGGEQPDDTPADEAAPPT